MPPRGWRPLGIGFSTRPAHVHRACLQVAHRVLNGARPEVPPPSTLPSIGTAASWHGLHEYCQLMRCVAQPAAAGAETGISRAGGVLRARSAKCARCACCPEPVPWPWSPKQQGTGLPDRAALLPPRRIPPRAAGVSAADAGSAGRKTQRRGRPSPKSCHACERCWIGQLPHHQAAPRPDQTAYVVLCVPGGGIWPWCTLLLGLKERRKILFASSPKGPASWRRRRWQPLRGTNLRSLPVVHFPP